MSRGNYRTKTILLDLGDWTVVRYKEDDPSMGQGYDEIFAEHKTCPNDTPSEYTATWSWEYIDGVFDKDVGYEVCWRCNQKVSPEAVALVTMMNMDKGVV